MAMVECPSCGQMLEVEQSEEKVQLVCPVCQSSLEVAPEVSAENQAVLPSLWYLAADGTQVGPLTEWDVLRRIREHRVTSQTPVWCEGMQAWSSLGNTPPFASHIARPPRPRH